MKKIACLVLLAGWFVGSYATDARVYTMGGHDNFFMDDFSIFKNPANINYYPNMLLGSPGVFNTDPSDTSQAQKNRNPQKPYFGPILSYSLNQSSESGTQYPLLSFGAIFNRYDDMLDYLDPSSAVFQNAYQASTTKYVTMVAPVGKIDVMLGYAMQNGMMLGVGGYFAFQREKSAYETMPELESDLYRLNVGINWPVAKSMNLEASAGIASVTAVAQDSTSDGVTSVDIAKSNISARGDIRLFSALTSLNGDFVPHLGVEYINLKNYTDLDIAAGLGVNVNIDKGFFWAGIEGLYTAQNYKILKSTPTGVGGRVSAGLERNVFFDWWVWRIGVSKSLLYITDAGEDGHWAQNPESDGSNKDAFSLGWGLNIENRLKVDVVMAEDMFYTFTNLISGNASHLTNRISCTYSF